jgi:phosphoglycolate phosphatase
VGDLRRLIVFDLDGTLIDSERDLADAVNVLLIERGAAALPPPSIGSMVGDGAAVLVRRAFDAAHLPMDEGSLPRFLQLYDERLLNTTRPYEGIVEALEAITQHGVLAVLTNKPLEHTERLLNGLDLARFFAEVLGGDGPLPRKPDPAGLRRLMSSHGAVPSGTILIGDSRVDADTAASAGTAFCLARYGFGARMIGSDVAPDAEVKTPSAIPGAVSTLLSR